MEERTSMQIASEAIIISLAGGRDAFVDVTVQEFADIGITVDDESRNLLNRLAERAFAAGALGVIGELDDDLVDDLNARFEEEHGRV